MSPPTPSRWSLVLAATAIAALAWVPNGGAQTRVAPATPTATDLALAIRLQKPDYAEWVSSLKLGVPEAVTFRWTRPVRAGTSSRTALTEKAQWQLVAGTSATANVMFLPSAQKSSAVLPLYAFYSYGAVSVAAPGSNAQFTVPTLKIPAKPPGGMIWVRVVLSEPGGIHASPWLKIEMLGPQEPAQFIHDLQLPSEKDWDQDGLPDLQEYYLAEQFKPAFKFDSDESARRPNEPVVIFRVRPADCLGLSCKPTRISIKYVLLFQRDGGYGPSSDCGNDHNGDNEPVTITIKSADGNTWQLSEVNVGSKQFIWPQTHAEFWPDRLGRSTHVVLYLSAHKHHQYFGTSHDGDDSPYSDFGCNDDVNGGGAKMLATIVSPGTSGGSRPNNVGEPEAHDPAHFINDLTGLGFPGENAWSDKPFTGGLPDDDSANGDLRGTWGGSK